VGELAAGEALIVHQRASPSGGLRRRTAGIVAERRDDAAAVGHAERKWGLTGGGNVARSSLEIAFSCLAEM
jgi:hypothetical protein